MLDRRSKRFKLNPVSYTHLNATIERIYGTSRENLMIGGSEDEKTDTADCA